MIARLTGQVTDEQGDRLVLDAAGVGYEVIVPPYPMKALRALHLSPDDPKDRLMGSGRIITLCIYHHATERNPLPVLFGFNDLNERHFFALLTTVAGFGPVAAAKSLTIAVPEYAQRIMTRDVRALCGLPGIGTAKAEQIIAKLRSKMALFAMIPQEDLPERPTAPADEFVLQAQIALEDLGYKAAEAERLIASAQKAQPDVDTLEDLLAAVWAQTRDKR